MKTPSNSAGTSLAMDRLADSDLPACGATLRSLGASAVSRQTVAERVVDYFYEHFRSPETGEPSCVLARCFQTSAYASLPLDYQDAADRLLDSVKPDRKMRCLALLATRGEKTTWNDVVTSIDHQAIPLPSVEVVRRAPMIARLLEELDISVERLVAPEPAADFLLQAPSQRFNLFHVAEALDSPFIPAQKSFVEPFGVKSVIGMGGLLNDGEFVAVILFTRVTITREVAERFRALAVSVREVFLPFDSNKAFAGVGPSPYRG